MSRWPDVSPEARFWAKVDRRNEDECWPWLATKSKLGYGKFTLGVNNKVCAHRYSYELTVGPIPNGLLVCHKCDNPKCVNPAHLFIGSHKDNMQDAVRKGRQARGRRLPQTKLTDEQVIVAIKLASSAPRMIESTARQFSISGEHLGALMRGKYRAMFKSR